MPVDLSTNLEALRRVAEEQFRSERGLRVVGTPSEQRLEYELGVHQVELRLQNEALMEANAELRASRDEYRDLYEFAPIPYLTLSARGLITGANAAACRMLALPTADLSGRSLASFFPAEQAEKFERHRRDVLSVRSVAISDFVLISASGEQREVTVQSACNDPNLREWRAAILDHSDVAELKRHLMRAERDSALGLLTTGIAHDFNNFLQTILAGAQVALQRVNAGADPKRSLELIRRAAWRGRSVVKQLHSFASGENTPVGLTDAHELVSAWTALARGLLGEDVQVRLDLAASRSKVMMDAGHLEQVLLNLAKNARQAMPRGGLLGISTSNVEGQMPAGALRLTVTDNGRGMDAQTRARAMEAFFTTKTGNKGSGLGLSMVRAVVEAAGGRVTLTSSPGEGTAVCLELPLSDDQKKGAPPSDFPVAEGGLLPLGLRVLLVEDDALTRRAILDYLEDMECEVLAVPTAREALDVLTDRANQIRLLLTDVVLPDMDGPSLVESARTGNPELVTLLTSAHGPHTLLERGFSEDDAIAVLYKPFTVEALVTAIRKVLKDATTIRPPSIPSS